MQLREKMVRGFVNMLAKNECGLYDVQFNNAKEQKLKTKKCEKINVSINLQSR